MKDKPKHVEGCALGPHSGLCVVVAPALPFPTVIVSEGVIRPRDERDSPTYTQMDVALRLAPGSTHLFYEYVWTNTKTGEQVEALSPRAWSEDWKIQRRVVGKVWSSWEDL